MTSPFVESINVGPAVDVPWGQMKYSAIDKRPTPTTVRVHPLGLDGDEIADLVHHGGPDQAVYAYSGEELDHWSRETGCNFRPGNFGENLTTRGIDVDAARIGERWRIGTTLLEVADSRIPCSVFQGFVDQERWVKRFTVHGRPGAYLRVIEPGEITAGDAIEIVETRSHDLTVAHTFRIQTTRRDLFATLAAEPRMSAKVKAKLAELRHV